MKIHQLLDSVSVIVTNEEQSFIDRHKSTIPIQSLKERDSVLARTLVRKGVYEVSEDSTHIILKKESSSV